MGIKSLWWFVYQGSTRTISVYSSVYLFISISPFLQNKRFATMIGFKPRWHSGKESVWQCRSHRRLEFKPWVGKIPWRRKWQSTPVFLPGESHGQRSLVGYSPWGCKESDTIEHTHTHTHTHIWIWYNCGNWLKSPREVAAFASGPGSWSQQGSWLGRGNGCKVRKNTHPFSMRSSKKRLESMSVLTASSLDMGDL